MTQVRWGILGTAGIAVASFLPAVRATGGKAAVVGSRNPTRAREWADRHGVDEAVDGYEAVLDRDDIDAVYVPLPNSEHAQWAIAALDAGKAVLSEKPLTPTGDETAAMISAAGDRLLWEAFVFPFHPQTTALTELVEEGALGDLRSIHAAFQVAMPPGPNIRRQPELGGGTLLDLGGYTIHFARTIFGDDPVAAVASGTGSDTGVDEELGGVLEFPGGRRLVFACGFTSSRYNSLAQLIGTEAEVRIDNPYHPAPDDGLELWQSTPGQWHSPRAVWRRTGGEGSAFDHAIAHIQRVVLGEEAPRNLAAQTALGTARAMDMVRAAVQLRV